MFYKKILGRFGGKNIFGVGGIRKRGGEILGCGLCVEGARMVFLPRKWFLGYV